MRKAAKGLGVWLLIGIFWLQGCKGMKNKEQGSSAENVPNQETTGKGLSAASGVFQERRASTYSSISPGSCRIKGRIVQVLGTRETDKNSPCGQAPCQALVQIEQLIGCGSGVTKRPKATQQVTMYFSLTLNANSSTTPAMPGLEAGSIFLADVQAPIQGDKYTVGVYEKQ